MRSSSILLATLLASLSATAIPLQRRQAETGSLGLGFVSSSAGASPGGAALGTADGGAGNSTTLDPTAVGGDNSTSLSGGGASSTSVDPNAVGGGSDPNAAGSSGSGVDNASSTGSSGTSTASESGSGSGSSSGSASASGSGSSSGSASASGSGSSSGSGSGSSSIDITVLQFAFILENLESTFYQQALQGFGQSDFSNAGFSSSQGQIILESIQQVQGDEATHAKTLSTVITSLGSTPFTGCQFQFGNALSSVGAAIATARTFELVGVSAYLGAAHLLTDPALLEAAGSILTLEARHQSLFNTFSGGSFAAQAFDIPLTPQQILALAGGFLSGCSGTDLGLTGQSFSRAPLPRFLISIPTASANAPLSIIDTQTQSTRIQIGSQLAFASTATVTGSGLSCQMIVGGAATALVFPADNCVVPSGINGPVYIFITKSSTPLSTNM